MSDSHGLRLGFVRCLPFKPTTLYIGDVKGKDYKMHCCIVAGGLAVKETGECVTLYNSHGSGVMFYL